MKAISIFFCAVFASFISSAQMDLSKGLVAFYPFSGTFENAANPSKHNGTQKGKLQFTDDRLGNKNSAIHIDAGDDNFVEIPFDKELLFADATPRTYNIWFTSNTDGTLLSNSAPSFYEDNNGAFHLVIGEKGTLSVWINNKERIPISQKSDNIVNVTDREWHLLTVIFTQTHIQVYVDCWSILNQTWESEKYHPYNSNFPIKLGGGYFGGKIDDVSIYNRELTFEEIRTVFSGKSAISGDKYPAKEEMDHKTMQQQSYIQNTLLLACRNLIKSNDWKGLVEIINYPYFNSAKLTAKDISDIYDKTNIEQFKNTPIYSRLLEEQNRRKDEALAIEKKNQALIEQEKKRVAYLKKATVGDLVIYTQDWQRTESFLLGYFSKTTPYTMIIKANIERIEGEKFQVRIVDVSSSNSQNYSTPDINGIKVNKGDIIWIKPYKDKGWFWGEDE